MTMSQTDNPDLYNHLSTSLVQTMQEIRAQWAEHLEYVRTTCYL